MSDPLNIQDMTPFQNTQEIQVTLPRTRRARRCGHCGTTGHDRRTCPGLQAHRERVALARQEQARVRQEQARVRLEEQRRQAELNKRSVEITNSTEYAIAVYWSNQQNMPLHQSKFKYLGVLNPWDVRKFKFYSQQRVVAFPVLSYDLQNEMNIPEENFELFLDAYISDLEGVERRNLPPLHPINIVTPMNYKPPKTELEQWKEAAFKSLYLLKELERMGASKNENLAPMIDMIQDINIPTHTQHDKEFAGVPSTLTNIT